MCNFEIFHYGIKPARARADGWFRSTNKPPVNEIAACREWLQRYASKPKTKAAQRAKHSYTLKHLVERVCNPDYVSNGALIQAAIDLGYEWFREDAASPNVYFYMTLNLPRAYRDGKRPVADVEIINH